MDTVVLKNSLIASLVFVCVFLVFQNIDHRVSERIQLESTSAAFESLDKDFSAIKRNVDTEFNKLPKYVKPSKEQSINDALEFIKFSKQTFTCIFLYKPTTYSCSHHTSHSYSCYTILNKSVGYDGIVRD